MLTIVQFAVLHYATITLNIVKGKKKDGGFNHLTNLEGKQHPPNTFLPN